jgi:hypothetical protein
VPSVTNSGFCLEGEPRLRRGAVLPAAVGSWALLGVFDTGATRWHVTGTPSALPVAHVARVGLGQAVGGGVIKTPVGTLSQQPINRKPYIYMTRVNASGDGASGPHPEREPA